MSFGLPASPERDFKNDVYRRPYYAFTSKTFHEQKEQSYLHIATACPDRTVQNNRQRGMTQSEPFKRSLSLLKAWALLLPSWVM